MSGKNSAPVSLEIYFSRIGDNNCRHFRGENEEGYICELPLTEKVYSSLRKILGGCHPDGFKAVIEIYPIVSTKPES
ncbi:MAG: hypothetical protein KKB03_01310 [Nanoarchaeota archaeon]|nr:hypothetical protein [Nanoarchaeota archaeon]MBU1135218.1 hypothetical protein [Nanoarchaeota archaeon]MBU2519865.1 hypothetical protein [Nanoarchaeota archaeon]